MSGASASADVAVLGAGPAGLAGALFAARAGRSVVVLERAEVVGGMAASFEVAGVRVDHGSHRLHPTTAPELLALLRTLLGDELQWRTRNGRIALEGRWISFPLRPAELARRLPPSFAAGVARDAVVAPFRRPRADTFAEEVRAGVGATMGERFYFPYARKLWGAGPEELSGEHARRRIGTGSPLALAARALRGAREPSGFWYPRRGFGRIVEVLAEEAQRAGAEIRLGAEVAGVEARKGAAVVRSAHGEVEARHVWSTLPLPVLGRLLGLTPVDGLAHRAMTLLYLVLDRPRWTGFDAHYLPGPETAATRVSEPRNYRDGRGSDPPDRTVLCVEVPCAVGDETWVADGVALGESLAADLAALGLPPADPSAVEVRRIPAAYPVHRPGSAAALAALERAIAAVPGVVTLGRHGLHSHDNTHHALAAGLAAARALRSDGSFDPASWARSRAAFRANVVED